MNVQGNATGEFSIVALDKFIQATRDSGYKGTSSAVAELVDNSLQAGATIIAVQLTVDGDDEHPIVLTLSDNGTGMDSRTLRTALRFGGSTRFNDRNGLGRYGMGLPNSSLSQAKRVTVHTWGSKKGRVLRSYLDIDEIVRGDLIEVPKPTRVCRPAFVNGCDSGTVVTWTRCDRLDNQRISTITRKLLHSLGRRFRYFLWEGASITVNGDSVMPIDPLFLHPSAIYSGATQFAEDIVYEVAADPAVPSKTGLVRVRFAELPAGEWSKLTNEEKRAGGIVKGAGVSIVRAGREGGLWLVLLGWQAPRELRRLVALRNPVRTRPRRGVRHYPHEATIPPTTTPDRGPVTGHGVDCQSTEYQGSQGAHEREDCGTFQRFRAASE